MLINGPRPEQARNIGLMDGKQKMKHLADLKRKLEFVNCPLVDEVDEELISGLLFQPSAVRTNLLISLVTEFDPEFENTLQNYPNIATTKVESRLQKLLFICYIMGLCGAGDLEIIKGTATEKEQITFWHNLLDTVITEQTLRNSNQNGKSPKSSMEIYKKTCQFMDTMTRQGLTAGIYEKSIRLFPPDMEKQLGLDKKEKRNHSMPSQKELVSILNELDKNLEGYHKELEALKKEQPHEEINEATQESICKKLDIAYKINAQQLTSFCMTYEHELQPWCANKARPKVSGLGDVSDAVHELIMDYDKLLHDIRKVRKCHSGVSGKLRQDTQKLLNSSNAELLKEKLERLHQTIEILTDSQQRLQSG